MALMVAPGSQTLGSRTPGLKLLERSTSVGSYCRNVPILRAGMLAFCPNVALEQVHVFEIRYYRTMTRTGLPQGTDIPSGELELTRTQLVGEEKLAATGRLASAVMHEIRDSVAITSSATEAAASAHLSIEAREDAPRKYGTLRS